MMEGLHLILHIAHGEPTFDIARQTEIAGEEAWMIHGWRAYPYWTVPLTKVCPPTPEMPSNHPWLHVGMNYPGSASYRARPEPAKSTSDLLQQLGLNFPKIERRI
jgi:hypothetical protein